MKTTREMVTSKAFKVMGTTDDVTTCDCCGRSDLKATVVLQPLDADGGPDGDVTYFGCVCAARALWQTVKYVREELRARDAEALETQRAKRNAEMAAYSAWLVDNYGVRQAADLWALGVQPMDALRRYRRESLLRNSVT